MLENFCAVRWTLQPFSNCSFSAPTLSIMLATTDSCRAEGQLTQLLADVPARVSGIAVNPAVMSFRAGRHCR